MCVNDEVDTVDACNSDGHEGSDEVTPDEEDVDEGDAGRHEEETPEKA